MERADSINASSRIGREDADGVAGCRSGNVCLITSVTKWRSDAELTLGITMASKLGACNCTISVRNFLQSEMPVKVPLRSDHPKQVRFLQH
jgi:hypothetical protein